ncbi:MGDG synthase family glycosyltransferase [Streptomyces kebangsaanensis]|uniref:MGDG synthase family glycosyltransferase n=1 Tax=Streptomyces kebangsaanensis TaxID=864058 RepID=UPI003899BD6D
MSSESSVPPPLPAARGPVAGRPPTRPGPVTPPEAERLLVVSASMGAGHDTVAAELARRARTAGKQARVVDVLALLPYGLGGGLRGFYQAAVREAPWVYAGVYDLFLRPGPRPRPSGTPLARLAGGRLMRLVREWRADVVVPVFHLAAQLTGHLRTRGVLQVPSAVVVVDFAVHRQWLHPGNDLHLCVSEETADEVRRGIGRPAEATGPVVAPEFFPEGPGAEEPGAEEPGTAGWRQRIQRYGGGRPAVLVSAGAWGAGSHLPGTARLLAAHGFLPVVLCGRNERLWRALSGTPGVLVPGWVTDMPDLLRACAALVDNAAGQTAVQALAAGLPVIGHRPLPGHGAEGVRRMADLGLCDHAPDEPALLRSLTRLTEPGPRRAQRIAAGRALFREDALSRLVRVRAAGHPRS